MKKVVEKQVTKKVTKETEGKEFNLKEVFVLWKQVSKSGIKYLSGTTNEELGFRVVAYYNTEKKNPKEPDIRVYETDSEGKLTQNEVAALWEDISKNEKRYLTGMDNEKVKLIGFYSDLSKHPDAPYIRVYYKDAE